MICCNIYIYIYIEYSSVVQCSIVQSCIYRIIQYDNVSYITGGCRLATEADKVSSVPALISCETLGLPQGRMSFHLSLITRAFLDGLATFKVSWPLIDAFRNYMKSHSNSFRRVEVMPRGFLCERVCVLTFLEWPAV
jgi:hypothetical protein